MNKSNLYLNLNEEQKIELPTGNKYLKPGRQTHNWLTKDLLETEFFRCDKCKEYFDEISHHGLYHPQYDENKVKYWCITHYPDQ